MSQFETPSLKATPAPGLPTKVHEGPGIEPSSGVKQSMLKKFLITLLTLSGIFEIYQAVNAFLNPPWLLSVLQIPDGSGARTLNHITAWFFLLVSVLILTCIDWIRREKREGFTLTLILGLWWIGVGVGIYAVSGITTNLYADSLKGVLVAGASFALLKGK